MVNKLSSIFVLLLILIIALITYWLKTEVEKELLIKNNNNASGPEFYLKSFNSIQTKKNGDVKFTLITFYEGIWLTIFISCKTWFF